MGTIKIKCTCPCHNNDGVKHSRPCCDNGYNHVHIHQGNTTISFHGGEKIEPSTIPEGKYTPGCEHKKNIQDCAECLPMTHHLKEQQKKATGRKIVIVGAGMDAYGKCIHGENIAVCTQCDEWISRYTAERIKTILPPSTLKSIRSMKPLTESYVKTVLAQYTQEKISFSRMVELLNEKATDAKPSATLFEKERVPVVIIKFRTGAGDLWFNRKEWDDMGGYKGMLKTYRFSILDIYEVIKKDVKPHQIPTTEWEP